jgi:hypothetical protein
VWPPKAEESGWLPIMCSVCHRILKSLR